MTLPNSVTTIGDEAFQSCTGLRNLTLGNSVTTIGQNVFEDCPSLTSMVIPSSVKSIGAGIFTSCDNLSSITVESGSTAYDSRNNCNAIIETASNTLIAGCKNTVIPATVTTIGGYAFEGCTGLTSIVIPNSVTTIGERAFFGCTNLASITLPSSLTSIGYWAFESTPWLNNQPNGVVYAGLVAYTYKGSSPQEITLKDGTKGIADEAFAAMSNLRSVTVPNSVEVIGIAAFSNCSSLEDITIPGSVKTIGYLAFCNCKSLTSVTIPSSVTAIGKGPFSGCDNLTSLVVASGNTAYDSRDNCNAIIKTATNTLIGGSPSTMIPNTVTAIGPQAFYYFDSISSIVIPSSVTSIGDEAFLYCGGLTSLTIPRSLTTIGVFAFTSCWRLTDVYCYITDPSSLSVEYYFFDVLSYNGFDYSGRTLHVPHGTADAYRANDLWHPFFGQIVEDLMPDFPGDVNADLEVNIADVNAVVDIILGGNANPPAADVNGDGEINIADINAIIDIILSE